MRYARQWGGGGGKLLPHIKPLGLITMKLNKAPNPLTFSALAPSSTPLHSFFPLFHALQGTLMYYRILSKLGESLKLLALSTMGFKQKACLCC